MNLAFYLDRIHNKTIGGGYTFQETLAKEIIKYPFKNKVIIYYKSEKNLFENKGNVIFNNLDFDKDLLPPKKSFFRKKKKQRKNLNDIFERDKIDVIYCLFPTCEIFSKVPYIYTIWDLAHKQHTYFPEVWQAFDGRERFYNEHAQKAAFVVIGNEAGKKQVCKYYKMDEFRVKTNPMPTPDYVYSTLADEKILDKYNLRNKKYLFYPAQFWAHKNHIRLLKAMKELKKQDFKMVFSGSNQGNYDYICNKIKEYNLEEDIINVGFVSQEEVVALYKNAYALTYASYFGPDNIPPLEAMALKCPVICSDYDGAREQLEDAALYFNKADEKSLIDAIKKLGNSEIKKTLIEKGEILAQKRHVKNYVQNIMKIIDEFEAVRECWGR